MSDIPKKEVAFTFVEAWSRLESALKRELHT